MIDSKTTAIPFNPVGSLGSIQAIFFVLVGLLLLTGYHRTEHFDDAWFAEQSYWLAHDGWVRSELFQGLNGWEDRIYVFHKLFIYAGAIMMEVLGFSLPASKVLTSLCALTVGCLIWFYDRHASGQQRWLAAILYFGCGTIIRYFAINRPEMMCMLLGFSSYYVLERQAISPTGALVAGALAGLAALTHLNGVIYLMAGFGWLFIREGWRPAGWFAVAGGLFLGLYVADALADSHLQVLINQFVNDPATQDNFKLANKLGIMLDYHKLFFHSYGEVPLSVLALLGVLLFARRMRPTQPILLYLLLLFVGFWLLTKSVFDFYYILFVPWLVLWVATCISQYLSTQPQWQQRTIRGFLVIYFGFSLFSIGNVLHENYTTPYVPTYNQLLAQHMPRHQTKVIAPLSFFFGQIDNYHIHGLTYYSLKHKQASLAEFFALAAQEKATYVISDGYKNEGYMVPLNAPDQIGAYQRIYRDKLTTIYERR